MSEKEQKLLGSEQREREVKRRGRPSRADSRGAGGAGRGPPPASSEKVLNAFFGEEKEEREDSSE